MVHVVLQTQNRDPLLVYLIPPMQISICICEALRAVPTHSLHGQFLEDREPNKFPFRPNLRNTQFPQQFLCIDKFNNFLHALQRETEIGLLGNWQASVQPSCYHIIELKKKSLDLTLVDMKNSLQRNFIFVHMKKHQGTSILFCTETECKYTIKKWVTTIAGQLFLQKLNGQQFLQ